MAWALRLQSRNSVYPRQHLLFGAKEILSAEPPIRPCAFHVTLTLSVIVVGCGSFATGEPTNPRRWRTPRARARRSGTGVPAGLGLARTRCPVPVRRWSALHNTASVGSRPATHRRPQSLRRLTVRAPAADSTFPNSAKAAFNGPSLARAVPAADIWRRHRCVNEGEEEWDAADHRRR